ncbi:hypothetical protein C8T65DRAFT_641045 [Cerioporus squamosus]|nr:hypothetical protein C8T65DRAFT_641045 [Cerioporus squamosus]
MCLPVFAPGGSDGSPRPYRPPLPPQNPCVSAARTCPSPTASLNMSASTSSANIRDGRTYHVPAVPMSTLRPYRASVSFTPSSPPRPTNANSPSRTYRLDRSVTCWQNLCEEYVNVRSSHCNSAEQARKYG